MLISVALLTICVNTADMDGLNEKLSKQTETSCDNGICTKINNETVENTVKMYADNVKNTVNNIDFPEKCVNIVNGSVLQNDGVTNSCNSKLIVDSMVAESAIRDPAEATTVTLNLGVNKAELIENDNHCIRLAPSPSTPCEKSASSTEASKDIVNEKKQQCTGITIASSDKLVEKSHSSKSSSSSHKHRHKSGKSSHRDHHHSSSHKSSSKDSHHHHHSSSSSRHRHSSSHKPHGSKYSSKSSKDATSASPRSQDKVNSTTSSTDKLVNGDVAISSAKPDEKVSSAKPDEKVSSAKPEGKKSSNSNHRHHHHKSHKHHKSSHSSSSSHKDKDKKSHSSSSDRHRSSSHHKSSHHRSHSSHDSSKKSNHKNTKDISKDSSKDETFVGALHSGGGTNMAKKSSPSGKSPIAKSENIKLVLSDKIISENGLTKPKHIISKNLKEQAVKRKLNVENSAKKKLKLAKQVANNMKNSPVKTPKKAKNVHVWTGRPLHVRSLWEQGCKNKSDLDFCIKNTGDVPGLGIDNLKYANLIHVEEHPNGSATVIHSYQDELAKLDKHEMKEFAKEYFKVCLS